MLLYMLGYVCREHTYLPFFLPSQPRSSSRLFLMNFCFSGAGNGLAMLFTTERAERESREFLTKGLVPGRKVITSKMAIRITATP